MIVFLISIQRPDGSLSKDSYKAKRKSYRLEKQRVANELVTALQDPAIVILADWLKVRGTLKGWTKLYCILKPGLLLLYKSDKLKVCFLPALGIYCMQIGSLTRSFYQDLRVTMLFKRTDEVGLDLL